MCFNYYLYMFTWPFWQRRAKCGTWGYSCNRRLCPEVFFLLRQPFKPRIVQWSLSGIQQLVYSLKAGEFRSVFQIKMSHRPRLEVNTVLNVNMVSKDALVLLLIFLPTATTHLFFSLLGSLWIKENFYYLHSYEILNYLALSLLFVFLYYSKKSKFSLLY